MISAILFDFGGTLDADGQHWLDRFYRIYAQIGLSALPKKRIKEAFYWADERLEADKSVRTAGFRQMMERHAHYQFEKLGLNDPKREARAAAAFYRPSEKVLHRNRRLLEHLHQEGLRLGVVSNFYGNVATLCEEAGLKPLLSVILDSLIVGLKKPDPKLFQLALDQLKLPADRVAFVGDSFERDIVPAKSLGMTTFWMVGDADRTPPDPSKVDHILHSLEDLPRQLFPSPGLSPPRGEGVANKILMKSAGIIAAGWGERLGQKIPKALTKVNGKALIDYTLDGFEAAGIERVTCIVNEAARAVPEHVAKSGRKLEMDWIIRTTPSSMHSFLIVLERLARHGEPSYFMTTVDSICPPGAYAEFITASDLFPEADVTLGLTTFIDDEKPLRVAMRGAEQTGLMPKRVSDNPGAFEIIAMTSHGFDSEYVTAGFYRAGPKILKEKQTALAKPFTALRQYLGYLLKYGYRFYGVPLPAIVDVDRPQDIQAAEALLKP